MIIRFPLGSSTKRVKPTCDCGAKAKGPRPRNDGSGWFFLCEPCDRTWQLDGTPDPIKDPGLQLRDTIKRLLLENGIDPDSTLDSYGLIGCCELLDIDIRDLRRLRRA